MNAQDLEVDARLKPLTTSHESGVDTAGSPQVRFCQTPEGASLAYAEVGDGAPLVMLPGWLSHLRELWTHPAAATARDKLAVRHRFLCFDRLGCGLSSRHGFNPSLESDIQQLRAVLDSAGITRASLIGHSFGGASAAAFAARYPERVERLVFCSSFARGSAVMADEQAKALKFIIKMNWELGSRTLAAILLPDGSSRDLRWFSRFLRHCATAEAAAQLLDHLLSVDVIPLLPQLRVPVVVFHNRDDETVPLTAGEEIAALVPGARLHVLDGNGHGAFLGAGSSLVNAITDFCAGRKVQVPGSLKHDGDALSRREREVLQLIAAGAPNKVIACKLGIAVSTVERHITNIYNKLGVRGRTDAAMRAVALKVASPVTVN